MRRILSILLCVILVCSHAFSEEKIVRDGSSIEKAVIIKYTGDYQESIGLEYKYIGTLYGVAAVDYKLVLQSSVGQGDRTYDVIEIELIPSGEHKNIYFDVTDLMNQWKF